MGEEPTGNRVTCTGMVVERFEDGKIVEAWRNWDALALLSSIGVVATVDRPPAPATS
jgi:predicted ester cyclase